MSGRHDPVAIVGRRTVPIRTVLVVSCSGVFMAFLDNTIVSIAFPNMLESFSDASLGTLSWVFNVYNIALAALLVPAGRFTDLFGRRKLFAAGVVIFTVASALCAVAPSIGALIAARALQGAGAAIILPASLGLILAAYPEDRRNQAVALWSATGALAAGLGPSIGGLLVNIADWRLVFLINLPIGLVVWRMANSRLVESRAPGRRSLPDMVGALLLAIAIALLSLAIVQGEDWGWLGLKTAIAMIVSAFAAVLLARRSRTQAFPIIDLELLTSRGFAVSGALTIIGSAGFFAVGLANVLYLMQVWGYSPLQAGLAGTPAPFLAALAAVGAGRLLGDRDPRLLIAAGGVIWALGPLILIERFSTEPHYLTGYLPGAAVLAIGIGVTFPLVSAIAVAHAPGSRYAGATALNSAIRQVGAALGVAILVALVGAPSPGEVEQAFERAWLFCVVCFGLVAVGSLGLGRLRPVETVEAVAGGALAALPLPERTPQRRAEPRQRPDPAARRDAAEEALYAQQSAAAFIGEVSLFAGLTPEARESLAQLADTVTVAAGSWLFRQGDDADALYVVRSGRMEIVDETPGREPTVLRELRAGAALGELAIVCESQRTASVRARRDARLLRVGRDAFESVMQTSPTVSRTLMRTLAEWLSTERGSTAPPSPTTIAVVALDAGAAAAGIDVALAARLGELGSVRYVTSVDVAGSADLRQALSALLDRVERDHVHVVLAGGVLGAPGTWTEACLRQADRVLLTVETAPAPEQLGERSLLTGSDVVLLGPNGDAGTDRLLRALEPRTTYRVRDGARRREDIGAVARRLAGRSVGLVLSGGGARCLSQVGVIEELQACGVRIDRIAGTSMGAFIGALLAQELDPAEIDARCYEEWVRRNPLGDWRFPRTSLLRGERARAMLERNLPGAIEDLPRGFFCVSVDLIAAEVVQHRRGPLALQVGASMALPIFAPPVVHEGRLLLDGALMDNLPSEAMAADREGPIIAVDATEPSVRALPAGTDPPVPSLMETLYKVMLLSESDSDRRRSFADLLISPDCEDIGILEFHMLDRMRDAGRRAAAAALADAPPSVLSP